MKEVYYKEEVREQLISGINKLHDAVAATFGPNGSTVIIPDKEQYGKYKVTKDGVSVANAVQFKNPIENTGAQLVKAAAQKSADEAGDGTTTATILATALINNLKDFKSKDINKALNEIIPKVIEQLKSNSRKLNREDIKYVASISANNDTQIGNTIQQAYNFSNIVKIEESSLLEDDVQTINGMLLQTSYFHKDFVNNPKKGTCDFNEPKVLIIDGKLDKLDSFKTILDDCAINQIPLLIIVEHVHEQVLFKLRTFVVNQQLEVCVIKSPGFGPHRKDLLNDLCSFTGATLITDMSRTLSTKPLGQLKSITIGKNSSILTKIAELDNVELIQSLLEFKKQSDLTDYDKDLLEQRINNLTGNVSIIKVGGRTENEMKERFDRYDDAVKAVACALEEGIVEGGGNALSNACDKLCFTENYKDEDIIDNIFKSLDAPFEKIGNINIPNYFDINIIDPLKVTRCALENAVSVAKTILSTDVIVLNETEWK